MASLFVIRGKDSGKHFDLHSQKISLGRDSANQIQLHDNEISRHHARLERDEQGCWTLYDQGSSNGCFVNSSRISSHQLGSGDRVQLGGTLMIFSTSSESGVTAPGATQQDTAAHGVAIVRTGKDDLSQIRSSFAPMAGMVDPSQPAPADSSTDSWSRMPSNWDMVYRVGQAITRTLDIDELMRQVLDLIFQWVHCDCGCVMLFDEVSGHLTPAYRRNRKQGKNVRPLEISKTILDYVMSRREGVLTSNAQSDARWQGAASIVSLGIHEAMCVPMQGRYGVVGAIYVDTSTSPGIAAERKHVETFSEENLALLAAIANQAALAIEDTQFYRATLQSERMAAMGQTVANLSHHVKNILQGIRGGSYLIEQGLNNQNLEVARKGWRLVERNQDRISNLVMDMLSFSKERVPELVEGDLRILVSEVVELMASRAEEVQARLVWQPPTDFPLVRFDAEAMHRAVLNVVTNAIDAVESRPDGCVRLMLQVVPQGPAPQCGQVELSIEDNGEGINSENLERIFSVFESKKGARGTGLGLPVSRKILREHGGDIIVESQPGKGARFTLRWPGTSDSTDRPTLS